MKKLLSFVAVCAVVVVAALGFAPEAEAFTPPIAALDAVPASSAYGTGENDLSFGVVLSDGTGIATTITAGSTFYPVKGTAFSTAVENHNSAFSWDETTGVLTATSAAAGRYLVVATVSDVIGNNNATLQARLEKDGAQVGNLLRKIEPASAARGNMGTIMALVDVASGTTLELNVTSGTNADTVTIRDASIVVYRIGRT